jgi:DNA repair/transcription protein MET18/MMS19
VTRVVRTNITTGDLTPPQGLVDGINTGRVPILDIVKALGEYLTTTEDDVRLKG